MRYAERLARASAQLGDAGLDALLVAPAPDLVYLTGYDPPPLERLTLLIVRPGLDPVLVVPLLERPIAASSPAGERLEVLGWSDAVEPYAFAAAHLPERGRVAVADRMWASHLLGLGRAAPGLTSVASSSALPLLRAVKDPDELDALHRAGLGADAAFGAILAERFAGRSEDEIAADLSRMLQDNGHQHVAFTIVGSGPNAASPHHEAGPRVIQRGDPVVMDFGGTVDGYGSDITRVVSVGEPSAEVSEVHAIVVEAQEAAFAATRPGVRAEEVDRAARTVIEDAGYGERFIHRTGHGIGLEAHEPPWIIAGNEQELVPGMTFSIEPGIYLPERFGIRIEDIVAVTDAGAVRLNEARRDLVLVT